MAGLKTLAKELQSKGRNGDTILAHINPQEAGILKALGGSGTINPDTGLPEYFYKKFISPAIASINPFNPGSGLNKTINTTPVIGDINKAANKLGTQVFQPFEKAIVQPVSKGLSEFDKQVARTIPGGWATVGQVVLSSNPATAPLGIALGAARGAGLTRTGSSLQRADLQGAIIGGATAYASAELGEYIQGAAPPGTEPALLPVSVSDQSTYLSEGIRTPISAPEVFAPGLSPNVDPGYFDLPPTTIPSAPNVSGYDIPQGAGVPPPANPPSFLERIGTKAGDTVSGTTKAIVEAPTTGLSGVARTGEGIGNLLTGGKSLSTVDPIKMGALALYGETSLAGLEEQRKYLEEAKRANAISQAEYDAALGEINRQRDYAADVVSKNPFNPNPSRDVSIGETFYGRSDEGTNLYDRLQDNLYAMGGQVDDELGGDYSAMGMDQGNLQKGLFGLGYAEGGTARFLSGGGDGMSDSIKATINEKQPARLADGEFVIPADVVSHLGNGSSKAGAKQLYAMMDRVRSARTGRKSQGKQINPRKYMTA